MRESFEIKSSTGVYRVQVGSGLLETVLADYPKAFLLVDSVLVDSVGKSRDNIIALVANEETKSLERIPEVISRLRELGANRSSHLVAIGGGVIQDIATFAASVFMRGISWSYMPTTLLSMVDSCIGGKSSVNVAGYKNLVGNFYPPNEIIVDALFARTLNDEQRVGGLFEAAKICFAKGPDAFKEYLKLAKSANLSDEEVKKVALLSLGAKKWFIEVDEFDQKERLLLNFGHTFGHAIEAGTQFGVSHGIAVGIGMMVAAEFTNTRFGNVLSGNAHVDNLQKHISSMLESLKGVLVPPKVLDLKTIVEKFENDKKHQGHVYRVICPQKDGALDLVSEPKTEEVRHQILKAYKKAFDDIGWSFVYD